MSSKTVITKIIEKDVIDTPAVKPKKLSFNNEAELEEWFKNKKMVADYPKIKEELEKIKKEKAEKEKASKVKYDEAFKKWLEDEKKREDEKKQKEKKAKKEFEEWKSKKDISSGLSIIIAVISISIVLIFIIIAGIMQPKEIRVADPLSLQELNKNRAFE